MVSDHTVESLETLIEEFKGRLRSGEKPLVLEYAEKNPDLYAEIIEIFPTIASMENLKTHKEYASQVQSTSVSLPMERLGEYRVLREIGRGGMGIVYEAFQESLNRTVAVKVLPWLTNANESALKRFNREAQVAANLEHPNIIPVFGVGVQDMTYYYAMRHIRGVGLEKLIAYLAKYGLAEGTIRPSFVYSAAACDFSCKNLLKESVSKIIEKGKQNKSDLHELLKDQKAQKQTSIEQDTEPLPPYKKFTVDYYKEVAGLISQIARALDYAHTQGALHRDIKPANLLLDNQGHIWLADFGIARMDSSETLTAAGGIMGTMRYMAPEQFDGDVSHKSDLYSLGLVLYELVCLRPAFKEQGGALMHKILSGNIMPPKEVNPFIPEALEQIILKASAKSHDQRFENGKEMADILESFQLGGNKAVNVFWQEHSAVQKRTTNIGDGNPLAQKANKRSFLRSFGIYMFVFSLLVLLALFMYGFYDPSNSANGSLQVTSSKDNFIEGQSKVNEEKSIILPQDGEAGYSRTPPEIREGEEWNQDRRERRVQAERRRARDEDRRPGFDRSMDRPPPRHETDRNRPFREERSR